MAKIGILKLKKLTESLLDYVKQDYEANVTAGTISESFLYRCIDEDDIIDGIDYRLLAVELFTRDVDDSRKATVNLMFDYDKVTLPQISVREPAKGKGQQDAIGGMGEYIYEDADGSFFEDRRKSFSSQYELLVTSINRHEVIIMEEIMLALLISAQDTLALNNPFYNFSFSVKELMANSETFSHNLFIKSISINTSYDKSYPNLTGDSLLNKILFTAQILSE
jgi:hypothetical protein